MNFEFASKNYTVGQINAMIKKIIEQVGENGPKLLLQDKLKIESVRESVINQLGTTTTSMTTERFVAKDKFTTDPNGIKFRGILGDFNKWFLAGDGKIEEPIGERILHYGDLIKDSTDGLIIEELGGEAKVETTLTELYDLLKKQPNGEAGALLVNGYSNIFYIRDTGGVLRDMFVYWRGYYWLVYSHFIGCPLWIAGSRVFFRSS